LGIAPGEVPAYSSFYESLNTDLMKNRADFKSFVNGVFMGYKWQCVEFVRRWLYLNKGYIFEDVSMAYEVFNLKEVSLVNSNKKLAVFSFKNGSKRKPEAGSILVWKEIGEFTVTGHVAIITEVLETSVKIAEQNLEHQKWGESRSWSRELKMSQSKDGTFHIECSYKDTEILGWLIQTNDSR
jgi:glutathionylspermidine amidase/synthetase